VKPDEATWQITEMGEIAIYDTAGRVKKLRNSQLEDVADEELFIKPSGV